MQMTQAMMFGRALGAMVITSGLYLTVNAADIDDCVLNGLKGVNSDAAARMVRQACESKVAAARADRVIAKYGMRSYEPMEVLTWDRERGGSKAQISIRNTSDLTAILLEVALSTPDGQEKCTNSRTRKELYRIKLKPRATGVFVLGDVATVADKKGGLCIDATLVRGREPSAFDFNVGVSEPLSAREVEAINNELKEQYAQIETPKSVPPAASLDLMTTDLRKLLLIAPNGTGALKK